jgi:hypothetical protein
MHIDRRDFEDWMKRIMEKLDALERRISKKEKVRHAVDGELLLDNQDLCLMLNISKRTLQRHRSSERLPFHRIDQKTYYRESDVREFIRKHMQ